MKPPDDVHPSKPTQNLGFVHVFVPAEKPTSPTLLMLHGTGGDERDLLPLGRELWPGAALLSVRGKVLENGVARFFRRFAEGVFDVEDLKSRTEELAQFIDATSERYEFSKKSLIAVGYSNGANIAASLILLHPHYLAAAVLFRAVVPFVPDRFGTSVIFQYLWPLGDWILSSRRDRLKNSAPSSRVAGPM
jgi:predicted esterase